MRKWFYVLGVAMSAWAGVHGGTIRLVAEVAESKEQKCGHCQSAWDVTITNHGTDLADHVTVVPELVYKGERVFQTNFHPEASSSFFSPRIPVSLGCLDGQGGSNSFTLSMYRFGKDADSPPGVFSVLLHINYTDPLGYPLSTVYPTKIAFDDEGRAAANEGDVAVMGFSAPRTPSSSRKSGVGSRWRARNVEGCALATGGG